MKKILQFPFSFAGAFIVTAITDLAYIHHHSLETGIMVIMLTITLGMTIVFNIFAVYDRSQNKSGHIIYNVIVLLLMTCVITGGYLSLDNYEVNRAAVREAGSAIFTPALAILIWAWISLGMNKILSLQRKTLSIAS